MTTSTKTTVSEDTVVGNSKETLRTETLRVETFREGDSEILSRHSEKTLREDTPPDRHSCHPCELWLRPDGVCSLDSRFIHI